MRKEFWLAMLDTMRVFVPWFCAIWGTQWWFVCGTCPSPSPRWSHTTFFYRLPVVKLSLERRRGGHIIIFWIDWKRVPLICAERCFSLVMVSITEKYEAATHGVGGCRYGQDGFASGRSRCDPPQRNMHQESAFRLLTNPGKARRLLLSIWTTDCEINGRTDLGWTFAREVRIGLIKHG